MSLLQQCKQCPRSSRVTSQITFAEPTTDSEKSLVLPTGSVKVSSFLLSLDAFTVYISYRSVYDFADAEGQVDDVLDRHCLLTRNQQSFKMQRIATESDEDLSSIDRGGDGDKIVSGSEDVLSFRQFFMLSEWLEPRTTLKRLTVAIDLPSGVNCVV